MISSFLSCNHVALHCSSFSRCAESDLIEKNPKDQDVKYKTKESTGLDKSTAELASDEKKVEVKLSAIAETLKKIEDARDLREHCSVWR